jgi:glycogen operon protein
VNFSVFSRNATSVELLLFEGQDDVQPFQIIELGPAEHQTFFFWHVYVRGLRPGAQYAYRVDGPQDLHGRGFRFNRNKILIDPYALGITNALFNRDDAVGPADNLATSMRSVVIDVHDYDWQGDLPLHRATEDLIIYEMHVAGFTRHASSGVKHPGTFSGVIEKIPYLKELGITAVELLPVMQYAMKSTYERRRKAPPPCATTGATAQSVFSRPRRATAFSPSRANTFTISATW